MSIKSSEDITKAEDYYSAKSGFSDGALSLESLNGPNVEPSDIVQRIILLHDQRYDATYQLSQLRYRFSEIEKKEVEIMKNSTLEQAELQKEYLVDGQSENKVKVLIEEAAQKLGLMQFELNKINEEVKREKEKLTELEEQFENFSERHNTSDQSSHDKLVSQAQIKVLEEQRDQQMRIYEDLEFKQLEMEAKVDDDRVEIHRKIIEEQKLFLKSTRDQENRKQYLDEQQLRLMRATRKELERLESERNYCNQQISYYHSVVSQCTSRIEELTQKLDKAAFNDLMLRFNQTIPQHAGGQEDDEYGHLVDYFSMPIERPVFLPDNLENMASMSVDPHSFQLYSQQSVQHKLQSLTEIIRAQCPHKNDNCFKSNMSSCLSLLKESKERIDCGDNYDSTNNTDSAISLTTAKSNNTAMNSRSNAAVTFDCNESAEESISTHSPHSDNQFKQSQSDVDSEISNKEDNNAQKPTIEKRSRNGQTSKRSKQARPLTCFLPKINVNFDLRQHIESCGHDLTVCEAYVEIDCTTCQGSLWKLSKNIFGAWKKRWFYFDHTNKQLTYYQSRSKSKTKGTIDFKSITDVFIDHSQRSRKPQKLAFCIETIGKTYYLMASKPELVTLWVDVIFTGAEGYLNLHHPSMLNSITSQFSNTLSGGGGTMVGGFTDQ